MEQSGELNAFAAGGHIVAMTSWTPRNLRSHELEAILAHELGHHLRGHAWVGQLAWWYSWPAALVLRAIRSDRRRRGRRAGRETCAPTGPPWTWGTGRRC